MMWREKEVSMDFMFVFFYFVEILFLVFVCGIKYLIILLIIVGMI